MVRTCSREITRKVQPTSLSEEVLNSTSRNFATAQLPNCKNQPMLAPSQMKLATVREPTNQVALAVKASNFEQVLGVERAIRLADADQVGVHLAQAALDRCAVTLSGLDDLPCVGAGDLLDVPPRRCC